MNKIEKMLVKADHFKNLNWVLAIEILEKIIEKAPETLKAHQMLYHIYMKKKLYRKTEEILKRAIKCHSNKDYFYFLYGNLNLAQIGKTSYAIKWYEKVENKFPELELNLAIAYTKQHRRKKAIKILERILPKYREFVQVILFLSEQYIAENNYTKAINLLMKIKINKIPANADVHYLLGICYDKMRNWIQAYLYYQKAENFGMSSAKFYNLFGKCCQNIGEIKQAIKYFKKSISKDMFFIKSYLDLSKLYVIENDTLNANKYLTLATKIDPLNIWIAMTSKKLNKRKKEDEKS
ncbi:MAG: hypothetical protein ISS38_00310 [Candidatus Cloacimonetes bacterium]|nr:hypothetical protein [Candidatus Cloacimonadota bacterium]